MLSVGGRGHYSSLPSVLFGLIIASQFPQSSLIVGEAMRHGYSELNADTIGNYFCFSPRTIEGFILFRMTDKLQRLDLKFFMK